MKSPDDIHFSICMPVYNGRRYLAETLASVRAQTHPHWELIVVEDASPEPCRDLVEAFAATVTQRVIYHANPTNLGAPFARDEAHQRARHDYIAPLDCDDVWKPEHLAEFASHFATRDVEFVFTGCALFNDRVGDGNVSFTPAPPLLSHLRLAYLRCQFWTQPSSIAFTQSLLARVGPWSRGIAAKRRALPGFSDVIEDRNFFLHVFHAGVEPHWTGSITTYYRQHAASALHTATLRPALRAWVDHAHGVMPGVPVWPQRQYLSQSCANGGHVLRSERAYRALAARFYLRAWVWNPLRLDRLVQAAATRLGVELGGAGQEANRSDVG
ncbi:MAG: glycosyltransferase family A protein [Opitutaceae bacterium]